MQKKQQMKRVLQILTHKGMINGEFTCLSSRQAATVTAKN